MALADLVLRARVSIALLRDPRVSFLDLGVSANDGIVTLTGDVDDTAECLAAADIARGVDGVREVRSDITCGLGQSADTAEMVVQRLLQKLDTEFAALPDQTATSMAGYLQWALWMVYKFRVPDGMAPDEKGRMEAEAAEQALTRIAAHVGAPKALVALWMLDQAREVSESAVRTAPDIPGAPLVATPAAGANQAAA